MYLVPNGYRSVHNMSVYMKMRIELIRETKNMFPRKVYCMWLTMPKNNFHLLVYGRTQPSVNHRDEIIERPVLLIKIRKSLL